MSTRFWSTFSTTLVRGACGARTVRLEPYRTLSGGIMWIGETLDGKYKLVKQLRSGGMGAVYVADRITLGDSVAVKIILPTQNTHVSRARFLREAQAAARIRHPNVVQIFDFGQIDDNTPYFVMELLHGLSLDEALQDHRRLPPARAIEIFQTICAAVEAGHRRGVLHRDLKPANVFLAHMDDGRESVKVLDFGLARFTHEGEAAGLTNPGSLLGTYSYMSPEQVLGETVTAASDIYSLGVILYEMVTGQLPYSARSSFAMMERVASGNFTPPKQVVPDLPDELAHAIEAALAKDPALRPATPETFAAMLPGISGPAPKGSTAELASPPVLPERPPGSTNPNLTQTIHSDRHTGPSRHSSSDPPTASSGETTLSMSGRTNSNARSGSAHEWPDLSRFAARERELESLKNEYKAGIEADGRLIIVVGSAGVGKSGIVKAFGSWARAQPGTCVLSGRFYDYEGSQMALYGTFLTMLAGGADSDVAANRAIMDLRRAELEARVGDTGKLGPGVGGDADKWRVFAAIAAEFQRVAGRRHLILLFDDLQWAGRLHLELIAYLRRSLADDGIVVVGTARDVDAQRSSESDLSTWMLAQGRARSCTVLHLEPFDEDDTRAWLKAVFGRLRMSTLDIRRLMQATGGNPYYLYEVIRHLLTTGQIRRSAHAWECVDLERVALPESVNNAVRSVHAELDRELRSVLETASVIGDQFRFETLRIATDYDEDGLDELLERAVAKQIISDEGVVRPNDFRFCHTAARQVLYDDVPARRRRRLHERVVRALESVYGDRLYRIAATLCYHQHAVGNWDETLRWGLKAGEEALTHFDLDRAELNLSRAREAVEQLGRDGAIVEHEDSLRLDMQLGVVLSRLGRMDEARALLKRAVDSAASLGVTGLHAQALAEMTQCLIAAGDLQAALTAAHDTVRVATEAGDRSRVLLARTLAGHILRRFGRVEEAYDLLSAIHSEVLETDSPSLRAMIFQNLSWSCSQREQFVEGENLARKALELARDAKDPIAEQQALSAMAFVKDESGDYEGALQLHYESMRLSRTLALRRREAIDLANTGETSYRLGRFAEALANFEEALEIFVEIKDRACEGDCTVNLGRALLAANRVDEAVATLDRGISLCLATGRREYEAIGLFYIGEANLSIGKPDLAERAFEKAGAIFREQQWHDVWRVETGLARAAIAQADAARAREHVIRAVELVESARAHLPPHADYQRFSRDVAQVFELRDRLLAEDE